MKKRIEGALDLAAFDAGKRSHSAKDEIAITGISVLAAGGLSDLEEAGAIDLTASS